MIILDLLSLNIVFLENTSTTFVYLNQLKDWGSKSNLELTGSYCNEVENQIKNNPYNHITYIDSELSIYVVFAEAFSRSFPSFSSEYYEKLDNNPNLHGIRNDVYNRSWNWDQILDTYSILEQ